MTMNGANAPGWSRIQCQEYLTEQVPHKVYGSACIQCPYHKDPEWQRVLSMPASGPKLIQIDRALRTPGTVVNRGLDQQLYLHRSCLPIDQVAFGNDAQMGFAMECEGGCGL